MKRGLVAALVAYTLWGLFPIYWKLLQAVPSFEILGHRIAWSFVFLTAVISARRAWPGFRELLASARTVSILALTALLVGVNWFLYIWGVNSGRVVECSLGYFILPLMNVAFGVVVLRERLRPLQTLSIALAGAGVALRAWDVGGVPVLSLSIAATFAAYGILRKKIAVDATTGLGVETLILLGPAVAFLAWREGSVSDTMKNATALQWALLAGAGAVTSIPLLAFGEAAKRLPLTILGVVQYVSPSLQFLLGVGLYGEVVAGRQWTVFVLIWAALAVFTLDGVRASRRAPAIA